MANNAGVYVRTQNGLQPAATVSGPKGTTGNTGPTGPTGPAGPAGDASPAIYNGAAGTTYTLSTAMLPSSRVLVLSANLTIATLPTPLSTVSGTITMVFKQPATGGPFTVTFPTLEWPNDAAAPAMPTAANSELIVHLFWTGQAWRAVVGGIYYP